MNLRLGIDSNEVLVWKIIEHIKYKIHTGLKKCIDNDSFFSCRTPHFLAVDAD